ncbi:tRNA dimethylallyltransferase isoform X2 [Anguilla rostrata]|uniref:tRNA dimethylallyltransferase isoform X2 n=1 Tax=Anguilla rostrata TaxID=7938 RepID=UPI0030D611DA
MATASLVMRKLKRSILPPLVVILGATGTGKSKLAIEIGKRLEGEIISADSMQASKGDCSGLPDTRAELEKLGGAELHRRLAEVDPDMAATLHPHNVRKIARSLQVHQETGVAHSRLLEEQRAQEGGGGLGGPLRFPHACIFWLHGNTEGLGERLDKRVDEMLSAGLIDELKEFHRRYNEQKVQENRQDYQHGIFQSIGFKEFHQYLTAGPGASEEERALLLQKGPGANVPPVFGLDVTDVSDWEKTVLTPALEVLDSLQKGEKPALEPIRVEGAERSNKRSRHECEPCARVIIGELEWAVHLKSKSHQHHLKKKRKSELAAQQHQASASPCDASPSTESPS